MITRKNKKIKNKTLKNKCKINSIYWINLDRSVERRKQMIETLKDSVFNNMKKHRVKAIDATNPKFSQYLKKNVENVNLEKDTLNKYACLLSHIKAIEEFANSGEKLALIFEDDLSMKYKKYWKIDLETCICNSPKDWEIIQLYYFLEHRNHLLKQQYSENSKEDHLYSAVAYIINRKGATRFLNKHQKNNKILLDKKIRHFADYYIYDKMKTYVYKYPFFTTISNDSNIDPNDLNDHKDFKKKMEQLLKLHQ